jgi:hypothetical protein
MPSRLSEAGRVRDPYSENLTMSADKTPATDDGKIKDPADWVTGDEPMTGAQDSYLHTLARKAGEEVEDDLTKAEASIKIDELREKVGVDDAAPEAKGLQEGGQVSRPSRRERVWSGVTFLLKSPRLPFLSEFE